MITRCKDILFFEQYVRKKTKKHLFCKVSVHRYRFLRFLFQKKRTARKQSALYISNRRRRHFVLRKSYFVLDLELRSCNLSFIQRQVASGPKSYNLGPAATRALPASLPSYFLKFLMKRPARSSAFLFHSAASA